MLVPTDGSQGAEMSLLGRGYLFETSLFRSFVVYNVAIRFDVSSERNFPLHL